MNLATAYRTGLRASPRRVSAYRRGLTVVGFRLGNFPGYILDEIQRLDGDIQAFNADLEANLAANACAYERDGLQPPLDHSHDSPTCQRLYSFWSGPWMEFRAQWSDFRDNHDSGGITGWYQRFWGGSLGETLDAMRATLVKYRDASGLAGFRLTSPEPVAPRKGLFDAAGDKSVDLFSGLAGLVRFLVYGLLGLGAILLLGMVLRGGELAVGGKTLAIGGGAA